MPLELIYLFSLQILIYWGQDFLCERQWISVYVKGAILAYSRWCTGPQTLALCLIILTCRPTDLIQERRKMFSNVTVVTWTAASSRLWTKWYYCTVKLSQGYSFSNYCWEYAAKLEMTGSLPAWENSAGVYWEVNLIKSISRFILIQKCFTD